LANNGNWQTNPIGVEQLQASQVLVIGWYFPEIARLLPAALERKVLVLVSNDAPWLEPLRQAGLTLNFRAPGSIRSLVAHMQTGRNVFAMLDALYPDTDSVVAPFLGRPAKTASGALALAIRNDYTVAVMAPGAQGVRVAASLPAGGRTVVDLATWVNRVMGEEIARIPHRWLMWPVLSYRYRIE